MLCSRQSIVTIEMFLYPYLIIKLGSRGVWMGGAGMVRGVTMNWLFCKKISVWGGGGRALEYENAYRGGRGLRRQIFCVCDHCMHPPL